jgi:hypothetical protein
MWEDRFIRDWALGSRAVWICQWNRVSGYVDKGPNGKTITIIIIIIMLSTVIIQRVSRDDLPI